MLTMFKEPVAGETNMKKWPWSMRRLIALLCFVAFLVFGILSIPRATGGEWSLFIPCALAFLGFVLLTYFTTLGDLKETALKIAGILGKGDVDKT